MLRDIANKVAGQLSGVFNSVADSKVVREVRQDISEINEHYLLPVVRAGKDNRVVSGLFGAKLGVGAGLLTCTPFGPVAGGVGGFFAGLVGGPTAMEYIESWIKPSGNTNNPPSAPPANKPT